MPYKTHPVWKIEKLLFPVKCSQNLPHTNTTLLSHHIPKTAGSSLRGALERTLGRRYVYGIYENTGATEMSSGNDIWIPSRAKVLHGHFKPRPEHDKIFPFAQRTVWVRDPLERIWSLVGHLLELKERHPHYILLKSSISNKSISSQERIVNELILNNAIDAFTSVYSRFFDKVPISDFAFVGSKHRYENDLKKFAELAGVKLDVLQVNRRNKDVNKLPNTIRHLETYLQNEYEIVGSYL